MSGQDEIQRQLRALKHNPDQVDAHWRLARLWAGQGRIEQAIEHCIKASRLLLNSGQTEEALEACQAALELNPSHTEATQLMASMYARTSMGAARVVEPQESEEELIVLGPESMVPDSITPESENANDLASVLSSDGHTVVPRRTGDRTVERLLSEDEISELFRRANRTDWYDPSPSQIATPALVELPEEPPTTPEPAPAPTPHTAPTPRYPLPSPLHDDAPVSLAPTPVRPLPSPYLEQLKDDSLDWSEDATVLPPAMDTPHPSMDTPAPAALLEPSPSLDSWGMSGHADSSPSWSLGFGEAPPPWSESGTPSWPEEPGELHAAWSLHPSQPSSPSWSGAESSSSWPVGLMHVQAEAGHNSGTWTTPDHNDMTTPPGWERVSSPTVRAVTRTFQEEPSPLWSSLSEPMLERVIQHLRRVPAGEVLLDTGRSRKRDVGLFMIVRGTVELSLRGVGGRLDPLATLGQWDVFGESQLLTGRAAPMVAKSMTSVEVLALPETFVLSELAEELPGLMEVLRDTYHSRLKDTLFVHHPILRNLSPESRERLTVQALPAGGVAVTQGEPCDGLYVVLRGRMLATADGQIVASLQTGDLFNGDALTMDEPASTVTVQATGEEVALLQIDLKALADISAQQPNVVEQLVEHLIVLQPSYGRHGIIRTV